MIPKPFFVNVKRRKKGTITRMKINIHLVYSFYLLESDLGSIRSEALTAHHDTILADETMVVTAGAAVTKSINFQPQIHHPHRLSLIYNAVWDKVKVILCSSLNGSIIVWPKNQITYHDTKITHQGPRKKSYNLYQTYQAREPGPNLRGWLYQTFSWPILT